MMPSMRLVVVSQPVHVDADVAGLHDHNAGLCRVLFKHA